MSVSPPAAFSECVSAGLHGVTEIHVDSESAIERGSAGKGELVERGGTIDHEVEIAAPTADGEIRRLKTAGIPVVTAGPGVRLPPLSSVIAPTVPLAARVPLFATAVVELMFAMVARRRH